MRIYYLSRVVPADYDEYNAFVVCALDEQSARRLVVNVAGTNYLFTCAVIGMAAEGSNERIILEEYNRG